VEPDVPPATGMEDQLGALGLVLNAVVLWNTVYMNAALDRLRAQGYPVIDEDVARLSPFVRHHLECARQVLVRASRTTRRDPRTARP